MERIIIHVDMDAFYASVETRDDPSLKGKPLIVGALPGERGVVSTCSYEARQYGIRSGMNIREAYRLCPDGVYLRPDFDRYRAVSDSLHAIWDSYASASETVALDEAYLDVTEKAETFDGAGAIARTIKRRTREELGLSCSVGVAYSKTAAKTASEEKKPDGYFEIRTPEEFVSLILDRDVRALYTVGEKTAEKLAAVGIRTVREIRERAEEVSAMLGKQGQWIVSLASGIDDRPVVPYRPEEAKSIGREVTFQQDVSNPALLDDVLVLLSLCVIGRLREVGLSAAGVTLKITFSDMKGITRSRAVDRFDSPRVLYREASALLEQVERRPVRLIGVTAHSLSPETFRQMRFEDYLAGPERSGGETLHPELDALRERYGLDFEGNLDRIFHGSTLYRTIEYMRKHRPRP